MDYEIERASEIIRNAGMVIALTGAGISVESGIPDFRSAGGIWDRYDPSIYATIDSFVKKPAMVWEMVFEMIDVIASAKPNAAHTALARMEQIGLLKAVITQNIDNLHQEAGSKAVIEYHGNAMGLICIKCGSKHGSEVNLTERIPPLCASCGSIMKPAVIFFGEAIPREPMTRSAKLAEEADVALVIGTSANVYPAAGIPLIVKRNGGTVIEFNVESTPLSGGVSDLFIFGPAGKTLPDLLSLLEKK